MSIRAVQRLGKHPGLQTCFDRQAIALGLSPVPTLMGANLAARIRKYDRHGRFEYLPRQTPGLTGRFPALDRAGFDTGMRLIAPDGQIYVGADAVYHIARRLRYSCLFAWLYRVPGIHLLARSVYAWVAANRQSLSAECDDGTCRPL